MKKSAVANPKKNSNLKLLLIIVILIVALIAVFLIFRSPNLNLSPYEGAVDIKTAAALLDVIGKECTNVALGLSQGSCEDARGNFYDFEAFAVLRDLIGEDNIEALKENYELEPSATPSASSSASPKSSAAPSSSPTSSASAQSSIVAGSSPRSSSSP